MKYPNEFLHYDDPNFYENSTHRLRDRSSVMLTPDLSYVSTVSTTQQALRISRGTDNRYHLRGYIDVVTTIPGQSNATSFPLFNLGTFMIEDMLSAEGFLYVIETITGNYASTYRGLFFYGINDITGNISGVDKTFYKKVYLGGGTSGEFGFSILAGSLIFIDLHMYPNKFSFRGPL